MTEIKLGKKLGNIKPMHGVGQPPFVGINFSYVKYLKDAGIPFSRLHDVGGWYGANMYVDIPNLFRDFSADPSDPESYDFAFTDILMKALDDNGVEPFFRLGVTIENNVEIRQYRLDPPADPLKWAKICEGVIRHYTQGWANGFFYKIRYWEIWNEPDNAPDMMKNPMWRGTPEQYYELYDVSARYLKEKFPELKIGGYASCGFYSIIESADRSEETKRRFDYFLDFFNGFLDYIKKTGAPLDFFSWHSYDNIDNTKAYAGYCRRRLDEAGYTETETFCNEWNHNEAAWRGTVSHAAYIEGMMLAMQDCPLDGAMFYDARIGTSIYGSLFSPLTFKPFPAYYAFTFYNELYKRGTQVEITSPVQDGVYAVAAEDEDSVAVVLSNMTPETITVKADIIPEKVLTLSPNGEPTRVWYSGGHTFAGLAFESTSMSVDPQNILLIVGRRAK
ncbi:MAG: hypothetical protein KBT31_04195 [Firmicutes bacterium]|nr:hypothetical protein [Candidatus Colimorpha enterica]